jgi:fatty acid desaturase
MQEVFVRREVISSARLRELCAPSDFRGWRQTLSHLGALVISGTLLWRFWGSVWAIPVFIVHGLLLNFLYAGQHELSHWTVFRTAWLNEWVGRIIGFWMFYPRTFDQLQHIAHHRYTQEWARDGELVRPRYTLASYMWWMSGVTYWYTRWRRIVRFSCGVVMEPYIAAARRGALAREARWHATGYIVIVILSLWLRSWAALLLWLAPLLLLKFVHQMQNTIEHLGLSHEADVLHNTRSTRTNGLMRWMAWQMQYHTAHHAFPGVPFHRLRELHAALFTECGAQPPCMTYLGFQLAVLRAFAGGKTEADYPDDAAWIGVDGLNSHSS